ncbi:glycosyltransferase family 2 protein [Alteromonas gracilis]
MSSPAVSLVVPTRGGRERLPLLLDSLRGQSDTDFEVVVVVDGDVDDTASLLQGIDDLPVRAEVLPHNRGRAGALNAGFSVARGEIWVRSDDDLVLPPTYVADQRRLHASEPRGVVGLCRNVYAPTPYAAAYGVPADERGRAAAYASPPDQAWRHWGANVSARAEDHRRVGDYDEGYARYGWEDVDWGYRLHLLGRPIVVEPSLQADHHVAATDSGSRATRAFLSGRSMRRFERKHGLDLQAAEPPRSPWGIAVAALAARLDEDGCRRWGERIEAALPRLPRRVATKNVALLVEAAGRAGYLSALHDDKEG